MSEPLFGGFTMIISGGTKTAIKLSRPWQPPLPIDPEKCPFCTKPQDEIPLSGISTRWRFLPTYFTPHENHRLIIPQKCWGAEKLQTLGGFTAIHEALEIVRLAIKKDRVEMATFIHVGQSAGQNLGHAHWHLMEVLVRKPLLCVQYHPELLVHRKEKMDIFAAGARAGECLIIQRGKRLKFDKQATAQIADTIEWIVSRGNEKFKSTENRPPEFNISVRISADGYFRYADYCPILNVLGATECVFAPLEGGPVTLAWPHEVTAAYLRD